MNWSFGVVTSTVLRLKSFVTGRGGKVIQTGFVMGNESVTGVKVPLHKEMTYYFDVYFFICDDIDAY